MKNEMIKRQLDKHTLGTVVIMPRAEVEAGLELAYQQGRKDGEARGPYDTGYIDGLKAARLMFAYTPPPVPKVTTFCGLTEAQMKPLMDALADWAKTRDLRYMGRWNIETLNLYTEATNAGFNPAKKPPSKPCDCGR